MKTHMLMLIFLAMTVAASADDITLGLHSDGKPWGIDQAEVENDQLPRVLLIGDSIVNGYHELVRDALHEKAAVDVWVTGMNLNSGGLHEKLRKVLAQGPYDVIHFNIGLHGWPEGRIPEGQYEPLLRTYVDIYRKEAPAATLIWCSTTQITMKDAPTQLDPVNNQTIVERNAIAGHVMNEYAIETNDLYAYMSDKLELMRGDKFHWNEQGKEIQAGRVAEAIEKALQALDESGN